MASPYIEEAARRAAAVPSSHTPGPWRHDNEGRISASGATRIADVSTNYATLNQSESNARLIASTPDLLAAVKSQRFMLYAWKAARTKLGLADDHGELNRAIADTEAAIAKATTQP